MLLQSNYNTLNHIYNLITMLSSPFTIQLQHSETYLQSHYNTLEAIHNSFTIFILQFNYNHKTLFMIQLQYCH